jgi:hypothetical protein
MVIRSKREDRCEEADIFLIVARWRGQRQRKLYIIPVIGHHI